MSLPPAVSAFVPFDSKGGDPARTTEVTETVFRAPARLIRIKRGARTPSSWTLMKSSRKNTGDEGTEVARFGGFG